MLLITVLHAFEYRIVLFMYLLIRVFIVKKGREMYYWTRLRLGHNVINFRVLSKFIWAKKSVYKTPNSLTRSSSTSTVIDHDQIDSPRIFILITN